MKKQQKCKLELLLQDYVMNNTIFCFTADKAGEALVQVLLRTNWAETICVNTHRLLSEGYQCFLN